MTDVDEVLSRLVPYPEDGSRADGPVAVDAADRLLLDEARTAVEGAPPGSVVVVGDRFGALTLGAIALGATHVRVHQDVVTAEAALAANAALAAGVRARLLPGPPTAHETTLEAVSRAPQPAPERAPEPGYAHHPLGRALLDGVRVVLLQLPTSLAELTEVAEHVARWAHPDVVVFAGGRVKHMTRAMNDVLAAELSDVTATRARQKSRVLVARGVRPDRRDVPLTYPVEARLSDPEVLAAARPPAGASRRRSLVAASVDIPTDAAATDRRGPEHALAVVAHGAAFAGPTLDLGTRFLLAQSHLWPTAATTAVDLGCGTGILATVLALRYPAARVVATDRSAAATASAAGTAERNGVSGRVTVLRDDAGAALPDASADLILCNPPFHDRAALSTDAAHRMFATAGRVLRPGGELWTVFNTPLRYRGALSRLVGTTEHIAQDPRFTITRSVRESVC
ncbi:class I SAM-dependent methyltransferase [Antribacter gilvus]|uniref:class I SAM-dependent methyltransferase n=1 Tax=Antribacter gilvus TaxID=2304675 RepID=UPI000F798E10|nr:methyltransferase [Antribacter gilvus]